MKKFVIIVAMVIIAVFTGMVMKYHLTETTTDQGIELGDVYQLSDGTWIYFGTEGAIEIGR